MNLCEQYSAEDKIYYFYLQKEVEQFFYHEAELIDTRQFKEWLELMHEDISYFMPMRKNVKFGQHAALENTRRGEEISWFDEDKWTLGKRVEQILTGVHYAEEPLSRVSHLVTNIQLTEVKPNLRSPTELHFSNWRYVMIDLYSVAKGDLVTLKDGRSGICTQNMEDGQWIEVKIDKDIDLVHSQDIAKVKNLESF